MDFKKVQEEAKKLFAKKEFLSDRKVEAPVSNTAYKINVDNTDVPVVPEWTQGEGEFLVFNKLNSCLGLIGISADKKKLRGVHLSRFVVFDKSELAKAVKDVIDNYFKGYTVQSFGGSQREWSKDEGADLKGVSAIKDDANEKQWFFSINGTNIVAQKW